MFGYFNYTKITAYNYIWAKIVVDGFKLTTRKKIARHSCRANHFPSAYAFATEIQKQTCKKREN